MRFTFVTSVGLQNTAKKQRNGWQTAESSIFIYFSFLGCSILFSGETLDSGITILPATTSLRSLSWDGELCTLQEQSCYYQECNGTWSRIHDVTKKFSYGNDHHDSFVVTVSYLKVQTKHLLKLNYKNMLLKTTI